MNKQLVEFIEFYKGRRSDFLNTVYQQDRSVLGRLTSRVISPSQEQFVAQELSFQQSFLEDVEPIQKLRGKNPNDFDWSTAILLLKNKSERLSYQIDFLNYFHTFLAFALVIFVLLANKLSGGWAGWGLVAIICCFITKVFADRSNLRLELSIYKEIINLFEFHKATLSSSDLIDRLRGAFNVRSLEH